LRINNKNQGRQEDVMTRLNTTYSTARRHFLKGVLATGGATALVVANASGLVDPAHPLTAVPDRDKPSPGYRLTPHIRDYYRSLR
jgi:hypothetical protein